ncbi:hypothetical protein V8J36_12210 [Frigidibacter sp. MR17.14]|uniref:hypothetical protein n=1 Tax=Frigidibacter sp. MR17.14 TaxID=3126509 RepID=UPI00301309D6
MTFDLADLERRLNENQDLQADFMKDPTSVLEREGIVMTPKMKENLQKFVREMQDPKFAASGASTAAQGGIMISIGKSF